MKDMVLGGGNRVSIMAYCVPIVAPMLGSPVPIPLTRMLEVTGPTALAASRRQPWLLTSVDTPGGGFGKVTVTFPRKLKNKIIRPAGVTNWALPMGTCGKLSRKAGIPPTA